MAHHERTDAVGAGLLHLGDDVDQHQPRPSPGRSRPIASRLVSPPSDAPTITGFDPTASAIEIRSSAKSCNE